MVKWLFTAVCLMRLEKNFRAIKYYMEKKNLGTLFKNNGSFVGSSSALFPLRS